MCKAICFFSFLFLGLGSAHAGLPAMTTFTVTTTADELDGTNGVLSLREAVLAANGSGTNATIIVSAGIYTLSIAGASEDTSTSGDLDLTDNTGHSITIRGAGCGATIIDGGAIDRVFDIQPGADITLHGLTIRNGRAPDGVQADPTDDGEQGGGIRNQGTLAIFDSCIVSNAAGNGSDRPNPDFAANNPGEGGDGGGIWSSGSLTLSNCLVEANQSGRGGDPASAALIGHPNGGFPGTGGGIYNTGDILMIESTLRSNRTGRGGNGGAGVNGGNPSGSRNGGNGSALHNLGSATLLRSAIVGNVNGKGGNGGAGSSGTGGPITDGTAGGGGGRGGEAAIYNAGSLFCTNVTVSGNRAGMGGNGGIGGNGFFIGTGDGGDGGDGGNGGSPAGIAVFSSLGTTHLTHVTLAGNQAGVGGSGGSGGNGTGGGANGSPGGTGASGIAGGMTLSVGSVEVSHTLMADNLDGDGSPSDISGGFGSLGYNLVETTNGYALFGATIGNQTGVDPQLEPLADNGGPTPTQAYPLTSPARNAGDPAIIAAPSFDQRGFPRISEGLIDIGAYEVYVPAITAPVLHWPLDEGAGATTVEAISGETNVAVFVGPVAWDSAVAPTDSTASINVDIDTPSSYIEAGTLTSSNTYVAGTNSDFRILSGAWTMTAWIRLEDPQGTSGDRVIASSRNAGDGNAWWLWFVNNANGKPTLQFDFNSTRRTADFEIPLASNVFVVIQGDNSASAFGAGMKHRFALWDGTCWYFTEGIHYANAQLHDIELGSFNKGTRQFDGLIDDVRIFDSALPHDQLDDLARSDADADGTPDYLDIDDDNDGLPDIAEQALGTNTKKADSDGDTVGDDAEVAAGTDPLDDADFLFVASIVGNVNEASIAWPSASNRFYSIWSTSNLLSETWVNVTNNVLATPPTNTVALPSTEEPRVYLLEVE